METSENNTGNGALASAAEYTRLLVTAAAAALVLSVSLLPNASGYSLQERWCLLVAWMLFGFSALSGLYALLTIPLLTVKGNASIFSAPFVVPARISLFALVFGAFAMALGLGGAFLSATPYNGLPVRDARSAVERAMNAVGGNDTVRRVGTIELIRGLDTTDPRDAVWNIQFDVDRHTGARIERRSVNVQVSTDGKTHVIENT